MPGVGMLGATRFRSNETRAVPFDRKPHWRNEGIRVARDGQGLDVSNAGAQAIEALDLLRDEWLAFGKRLPEVVGGCRQGRA